MIQPITFKAAINGPTTMLLPLVKLLHKAYVVAEVEYGQNDNGVSTVVCKLGSANEYQVMEELIGIAMLDTGVDRATLLNWSDKHRYLSLARRIMAFILWKRFDLSLAKIGKMMGSASHVSIVWAVRQFQIDAALKSCSLEEAYAVCKFGYVPVNQHRQKRIPANESEHTTEA